ncbi:PREDICTED: pre-mRNA-splicing factor CWC22 homolog [Polistes dominula]|uniref:Pre-mRNA-splicing factor CWC22 homolog n=1 Tax=Polistes dominula TaxID=743375 RepID=A0ABM1JB92_POLDO|nr:PREDICTED: pre-mRNA-splicing factor CWC22 homolog [Polistes dominula]
MEKYSDKRSDKYSDKYSDRYSDRHSERRSDRRSERRSERYSDRRSERRSDKHLDKHSGKYSNKYSERKITTETMPENRKRTHDVLTAKTGGAYIPPAKLRMMQANITDKSGAAYQRIAWKALKKSIQGSINKVNVSYIGLITRELLRENIVRGRAALTAIINSKFPNIGEQILKRLIIQFKHGFRRNDKPLCISSGTFVAHLLNQRVAHEILPLEILTLLVETPTDDFVEVAIAFLKKCGMKLTEVSRKGIEVIMEMLKNLLHEGQLDKRVQYMIEVMFQIRKDGFKNHPAIPPELDLVEEENQFTHLIQLDEAIDSQDILNVFKFDTGKEQGKPLLDSHNRDSENNSPPKALDPELKAYLDAMSGNIITTISMQLQEFQKSIESLKADMEKRMKGSEFSNRKPKIFRTTQEQGSTNWRKAPGKTNTS